MVDGLPRATSFVLYLPQVTFCNSEPNMVGSRLLTSMQIGCGFSAILFQFSTGCRFEIHGMGSSDAMQIKFGAIAICFWSRAIIKLSDALNEQRWFVML